MGKLTPQSKFCLLRDSDYVKDIVKFKMEEFGISGKELSNLTGIAYYRIQRYLKNPHYCSMRSITQYQLLRILECLGVEVELRASIKRDKPTQLL